MKDSVYAAPSVAIETHGCKLNQADSSRLAWEFVAAGFRLVSTEEPSDVYVVNTCTVTHVADKKARQALRAARRRNPDATIVATGCYAQNAPDLLRGLDEIDLVAGNVDKPTLVRQIVEWMGETPTPCAVGEEPALFGAGAMRTRAMVKIQEGCDQICAYCIVPKVRGRERSIPPDAILAEVSRYLTRGYKEVVLTGTQLGTYGFDLPDTDLADLVRRILCDALPQRLRVSSLQPQEITPELLDVWKDERMCPHFHMPLQSGSDAVLTRMRRRYTARQYRTTVDSIRRRVPAAAVTGDVIVGFPGETEDEFQETYSFCEDIGFADLHVFPYSVRPGTSAAYFQDQVSPGDKSRRMEALLSLAGTQARRFRQSLVGQARPVLWEGSREVDGERVWSGLTDNYVRVFGRSRDCLTNIVTAARLIELSGDDVRAEILGPVES